MPEGDSLHRAARLLQPIVGGTIARMVSSRVRERDVPGHRIEAVEARGKNLVVRLDDGRAFHVHLRMTGAVHLYKKGERWRRSPGAARLVLEVGDWEAVVFAAPVVRLVLDVDRALAHLGPDLLGATFDRDEARRRLRALGDVPIGEALLDQRAVAGIGNVYKSETLFVCRVDPRAKVSSLDDAKLDALLDAARRLMKSNLRGGMRTTARRHDSAQRFWVYGRANIGCARCGTLVQRIVQAHRSTYFCPRCQV